MYCSKNDVSDFLKELNEQLNDKENSENVCLIGKDKLEDNHITLPCSHKFNYLPLYKEICSQKIKQQPLEIMRLQFHQIKCPYCRTISNGLLPYQHIDGVKKKNGVNYPIKYSLPIYKCKWIYKNGNLKGTICNQTAGLYDNDCYCSKHMYSINTNNKTSKCDSILISGKRKGEVCGCKCFEDTKCKRHLKKK